AGRRRPSSVLVVSSTAPTQPPQHFALDTGDTTAARARPRPDTQRWWLRSAAISGATILSVIVLAGAATFYWGGRRGNDGRPVSSTVVASSQPTVSIPAGPATQFSSERKPTSDVAQPSSRTTDRTPDRTPASPML